MIAAMVMLRVETTFSDPPWLFFLSLVATLGIHSQLLTVVVLSLLQTHDALRLLLTIIAVVLSALLTFVILSLGAHGLHELQTGRHKRSCFLGRSTSSVSSSSR